MVSVSGKNERKHQVKKNIPIIFLSFLCMTAFSLLAQAAEYSLSDLYKIALEKSEKIQISEQNQFLAEAAKNKKRAILMPKLSAYGSVTDFSERKRASDTVLSPTMIFPGTIIQPDYAGQWGLRLDQAITLNGKEITDFNIAKDNILKQEKDTYVQKEDYMLTVAMTYYETLRAQKALDIAESAVNRMMLYRSMAEKRLKVGEVTKTVLLRADGELSGARSDQIRAKNALDLSRAVLARVVGIKEDFVLKETLATAEPLPPLDDFLQRAFTERAEVMSAKIEKKMAEHQISVAKGGYWPTLSIAGVYGRLDQYPVATTTNRESAYGQMSLNFPFFEGGLREAEVAEARIKDKQAQLKLEDLKKTVRVEVETAYAELKNQRGILKALEDQLVFAKDNYRSVSKQFEYGLANSVDVMDAHTLLVSAERQWISAIYTHQAYQLRIKRFTGLLLKEIASTQKLVGKTVKP